MDAATLTLSEAKQKFPRAEVYELMGQPFLIRPPSREEWRKWQQDASEDRARPIANEWLVQQCVVYPDSTTLNSLLDQFPAFVSKLFEAVYGLAGGEQKAIKKG